eukprot:TRINITY_DN6873_c0_g1_i1.p1 TRINITY_DN6873_c0_g1~~TRINITY_DN6873_c0_g1_i1.p1  ORF type:complete len:514 (-),score=125.41 TRINITY_DN6873_c0_g1_i1:104-1645(-)
MCIRDSINAEYGDYRDQAMATRLSVATLSMAMLVALLPRGTAARPFYGSVSSAAISQGEGEGCDPTSLAPPPGTLEHSQLPFMLLLRGPVPESGAGWCLTSVPNRTHSLSLAECTLSGTGAGAQGWTLTGHGLLQSASAAGHNLGACPARKGCLAYHDDGGVGLHDCADAHKRKMAMRWYLRESGELESLDDPGSCVLATNALKVVVGKCGGGSPGRDLPRVVDGKLGTKVYPGQPCFTRCFERTGARWEDLVSFLHGWCFTSVPPKDGSAKGVGWGSCAAPGTVSEPNPDPSSLECPGPPTTPPVANSSSLDMAADLIDSALTGRRLLQTGPELEAQERELEALAKRRTGASEDEERLRKRIVAAHATATAAQQACATARISVKQSLERTKKAFRAAERSEAVDTTAADAQAANLHQAERQVDQWCEKENVARVELDGLRREHEMVRATAEQADELNHESSDIKRAVQTNQLAVKKMANARSQLKAAHRKAADASAAVTACLLYTSPSPRDS